MFRLGDQLHPQQYAAFRQRLAENLPGLSVQTVNAAGKFMVHGHLTAEQAEAINALYKEHADAAPADFDMMAYQSMQRRRRQTHNARQKRTAMAMRFHK